MLLTYIKRFSFLLILVAGLVGQSFKVSVVYADTMCCLSRQGNNCHLKDAVVGCGAGATLTRPNVWCGVSITSGKEVCLDTSYFQLPPQEKICADVVRESEKGVLYDGGYIYNDQDCIYKSPEKEVLCSAESSCRDLLISETNCSVFDSDRDLCLNNPNCFYDVAACYNRNNASICNRLSQRFCGTKSESGAIEGSLVCTWDTATNRCLTRVEQEMSSNFQYHDSSLLTPCAAKGNCRSINDLLAILLKQTTIVFRLIGTAAFLFFVYGGFTIILSFGNPEKVQQGKQILTAAIIGIIIIFGAYILVKFILDTLGATGFASTLF
jgi:hypothetical protein